MLPRTLLTLTTTLTSAARIFVYAATSPCTNATPLLIQANNYRSIHTDNTCSITAMAEQPTSEWLQTRLSELLASPHIHFTQPNVPGLRLRMGPGPIDLFSTRFINLFTHEAKGTVNGQEVAKDELKEQLLKLQKKYNKETVKFVPEELVTGEEVATKLAWTTKDEGSQAEVRASATTKEEGGTHRIDTLKLDFADSLLA